MGFTTKKEMNLPRWVSNHIDTDAQYITNEHKMELVIELSKLNVLEKTGGPFGAAIFDCEDNKIISIGINNVVPNNCSISHAEILAIVFAEEKLKHYHLNAVPSKELVLASSSQPCLMCFGAIIWSGIKKLIYGASSDEVVDYVGFDEGPLPINWRQECEKRNIEVIPNILSDEAVKVLKLYKQTGGVVY